MEMLAKQVSLCQWLCRLRVLDERAREYPQVAV